MTNFQKFLLNEIKAYNADWDGLKKYNNGIEIYSLALSYIEEPDGAIVARYEVKCRFKPSENHGNDIAEYDVWMFDGGEMSIRFAGEKNSAWL